MIDRDHAKWRKSSFSDGQGGACVEVAVEGDTTALRDSKNPNGPILEFDPDEWAAFLKGVKADEFG